MTDYPVGQWIGWNGGECPVHPETVIEFRNTTGYSENNRLAKATLWDKPLLFRIVTPYVEQKKPREWLISINTMHVQAVPSGFKPDGSATSYVHVREVVEADG